MIAFDTSDLQRMQAQLAELTIEPDELLSDIGDVLADSTRERINAGRDPEGQPWAPWTPRYAKERKGPGQQLLQATGALAGSIGHFAEGGDTIVVESPLPYAGAVQALRPFLGITDAEDELLAVAEEAIEKAYTRVAS